MGLRWHAPVVKLVDTPDLGSGASRRVGSSPIRRTKNEESPKGFPRFAFYDIPWFWDADP